MSFTAPGSNDKLLGQMTISVMSGKYVLILYRMHLAKYAKYLIPFALFLVIFFIVYKTFRAPEPVGVDVNETFKNKKKKNSKFSDNLWSGWNKKSKKSKGKPAKAAKGRSVKAASVDGGKSSNGGKSFACKLTFYTSDPKENDGSTKTADGSALNAGSRIAAVSMSRWNELKGKRINIAGHGTYTVKDQCSSCASNQIDILVGSKSEANRKGVQNSTCTVG
ncbi:hypothetical protein ATCVMN08101_392L [Acanthocystis turfacea Chlorella virus MN0810.1]|nr:hypothetical protein ATCVMN08101_392L [Acanthocystis turfacea Chlorella virus MN0810.1]